MFGRPRSRGRSPLLRLLSLASALTLVLTGAADAYGLHRCAHHDALPGADATADAPAHGGHDAQHVHDAGHAPASDSPGHDDGCTCVGDCAGTPGIVAPEPLVATQLESVQSQALPASHATDTPRPDHAPHFHPFAQAPPLDR